MKKTIDDIIAVIAETNRSSLLGEQSLYTKIVQQFIDDSLNEPEVLLELLELFIEDKLLPIDKKQYNVLLNVALKNNKIDLLKQVPDGVSRMLVDAVKNNLNFGTILMDYIRKGGKVSFDMTDEQGKTALHYALEQKNVSETLIVYLLDCAEDVMKFKPLIQAFLAVPATEQNKEAWDYLSNRFKTEYASTQEEGECSPGSAPDEPLETPVSLAKHSFFYADEPLDGDDCVQAPKRLKL